MSFNIAEFLPDATRDIFNTLIRMWVVECCRERFKARKEARSTPGTPVKRRLKDDQDDDFSTAFHSIEEDLYDGLTSTMKVGCHDDRLPSYPSAGLECSVSSEARLAS